MTNHPDHPTRLPPIGSTVTMLDAYDDDHVVQGIVVKHEMHGAELLALVDAEGIGHYVRANEGPGEPL